jgi:class 3 adenylate cyclase
MPARDSGSVATRCRRFAIVAPHCASYRFSVFAHRRRHLAEGERRQVAVVFTYMIGFTAFSERSGEEAAYTLLQSLAKLMEDAVGDNEGVVREFAGRRRHGGL